MRDNFERISIYKLEDRDVVDPVSVAASAEEKGEDLFVYAGKIYDDYELASDLYETKENYIMACCNAKVYKNNPIKIGTKVEELKIELIDIDTTPTYDLNELMGEVINEMSDEMPESIELVKIDWTRKPLKSYFGKHFEEGHRIYINKVLDSKDVSRETVKYVIYHEILHEDMPFHGPEFRLREHKYPHWAEHDHELDTLFNKYSIFRD